MDSRQIKLKKGLFNTLVGFGSQFLIIILNLILPRLFIIRFGSGVNGLISTISQLFAYMGLLEAGIGAATVQGLYKPLIDHNNRKISEILSATKRYYKKVSVYYFLCVFALSALFPMLVSSELGKVEIALIILLEGLTGVINFYFQATIKQLIIAEGKNYIIYNITLLVRVLTSVAKISLILLGADLLSIQICYFVINLLQMKIYHSYFKKSYAWVHLDASPDFKALEQKQAFLVEQVLSLVFSNIDIVILSIFCGFNTVSIYSVYMLIIAALTSIINTVHNGLTFLLGQTYFEDKDRYIRIHDVYETLYMAMIFIIMSVCYTLYIPFLKLYTSGVDINYIDYHLPLLFILIQLLSCIKLVPGTLIQISGHLKETVPRIILEAVINLVLSIVLVNYLGIYGVLLGTCIALVYRANDIIFYANKRILHRKARGTYKKVIGNALVFGVVYVVNGLIDLSVTSYVALFICGLIVGIGVAGTYLVVNFLLDRNSFHYVYHTLKNILGSKGNA